MDKILDNPNSDNICAIVVLYYPDERLFERLQSVLNQIKSIIIIANDGIERNSSTNFFLDKNIIFFNQEKNVGLAKALNIGISAAIEMKYSWVLLLDQDTIIHENYLSVMGQAFAQNKLNNLGFLAPNYQSFDGKKIAFHGAGNSIKLKNCITSGGLIPINTLNIVGIMQEDFIIEGIDTEFALRVRKSSLEIICPLEIVMTHVAGEGVTKNLLGRHVQISNHSPIRLYLQLRNLTWIIKKYINYDKKWCINSILSIIKKIILIILYEENKFKKLQSIAIGIFHGFKKDLRKLNEEVMKNL